MFMGRPTFEMFSIVYTDGLRTIKGGNWFVWQN